MKYSDTVIIIPARFNSTRLPGKSIADINGTPMVVRILNIAKSLNLCDVFVATEDEKVIEVIKKYNETAFLTSDKLNSGTDRVFEALQQINKNYKYVINLQGDMPNIDGSIVEEIIENLHNIKSKNCILTAIYKIQDQSWRQMPQHVKVAIAYNENTNLHKCLYFSRSNIPSGNGDAYVHLGIYGYTIESLQEFVSLNQSRLEKSEKLEQLRALENDIPIYATIVDSFPISVDTAEDLELARKVIK